MDQSLPEPAPEMKQLAWFLGSWDVTSKTKAANGDWLEEAVTADHSTILGGNVIFEHFVGPLMGKPFEAWSLRKFNPADGRWEQRWVDTTPGGFADWTGTWHEEESQFIGHPNRVLKVDGLADDAVREVFFDIGEHGFSWKYETTKDAGESWDLAWSLEYRRSSD